MKFQKPLALAAALLLSWQSCALAAAARYFGLEPPVTPEPFRPALFDGLAPHFVTNPAFSPDFKRVVFTAVNAVTARHLVTVLYESRFDGTNWSTPQPLRALDAEGFNSAEATFSRDGSWIYFASTRPPGSPPWNVRTFRARVTDSGYGSVEWIDLRTGPAPTFYPQPLADGSIAITSDRLPGPGAGDVHIARWNAERGFDAPVAFGGDFNSPRDDWDLVEDSSGRTRLWASAREGGAGKVDIYFSRKDAQGRWAAARNLEAVNTAAVETAPRLTPDDQVLFFQRFVDGKDQLYWVRWSGIAP